MIRLYSIQEYNKVEITITHKKMEALCPECVLIWEQFVLCNQSLENDISYSMLWVEVTITG